MLTRVQKWGNSLAVRIPKAFAEELGLKGNAVVEISLRDGQLVLKAVSPRRWTLEDLLAEVTTENIHAEIDSGESVGREAW
jgi:antitoxin MazE